VFDACQLNKGRTPFKYTSMRTYIYMCVTYVYVYPGEVGELVQKSKAQKKSQT